MRRGWWGGIGAACGDSGDGGGGGGGGGCGGGHSGTLFAFHLGKAEGGGEERGGGKPLKGFKWDRRPPLFLLLIPVSSPFHIYIDPPQVLRMTCDGGINVISSPPSFSFVLMVCLGQWAKIAPVVPQVSCVTMSLIK